MLLARQSGEQRRAERRAGVLAGRGAAGAAGGGAAGDAAASRVEARGFDDHSHTVFATTKANTTCPCNARVHSRQNTHLSIAASCAAGLLPASRGSWPGPWAISPTIGPEGNARPAPGPLRGDEGRWRWRGGKVDGNEMGLESSCDEAGSRCKARATQPAFQERAEYTHAASAPRSSASRAGASAPPASPISSSSSSTPRGALMAPWMRATSAASPAASVSWILRGFGWFGLGLGVVRGLCAQQQLPASVSGRSRRACCGPPRSPKEEVAVGFVCEFQGGGALVGDLVSVSRN